MGSTGIEILTMFQCYVPMDSALICLFSDIRRSVSEKSMDFSHVDYQYLSVPGTLAVGLCKIHSLMSTRQVRYV